MKKLFQYSEVEKQQAWQRHRLTYDINANWTSLEADEPVKFIDRLVLTNSPMTILDLGCGFGRHAVRYHSRGISVIGLDFVLEGLKQLKKRYPFLPTVCADIRFVPFKKKIADLVLINGVLYEIEDIKEVNKVLKDVFELLIEKGTFIFVHDYYPDFYKRFYLIVQPLVPFLRQIMGKHPRSGKWRFNSWLWTRRDIRILMENAGFIIKKEVPANHLFGIAHWFDYLFYKRKGQYMPRNIQLDPQKNIRWLGRCIASISRRWLPYLCPATVYYEMRKDDR